ncbi:MAG: DUF1501 domain-containing protein [Myxococcota bacterium]
MLKPSRRDLLRGCLLGAGGLAIHSLATGLPVSFLRSGRVSHAQEADRDPTYLILALSSAGDPLNANCPGSYPNPSDASDPRWGIEHATVSELGNGVMGEMGGMPYRAADFAEGHLCRLGNEDCWAARPWADLPEALRARMSVIRHRTYSNAHPEFGEVIQFHGGVSGPDNIGVESLPSFIAQAISGTLGTIIQTPFNIGGPGYNYEGAPVRQQTPDRLQQVFAESGAWRGLEPDEFADIRDGVLDQIYQQVQDTGTHAQKRFIDRYARSREDARMMAEALTVSLAPIDGASDDVEKQIIAAGALLEHNIAPVVTLQLPFGGDNHQDNDLSTEVTETIAGVEGIRRLWQELDSKGLQDRVTFAYLSVFGRKLKRRENGGGRDHQGDDHAMVLFGPHVQPGLIGQVSEDLHAGPIADIPAEETLATAGKTLARAIGVPDEIIDQRIVGGRALGG